MSLPADMDKTELRGGYTPIKYKTTVRKTVEALSLNRIDDDHYCWDIGIVPRVGLLESKRLLISCIQCVSMDEVV